ncbi:MAG: VOC family protein [Flavobacteriales bacterium]|nr:VOC family protein [Flavobacteriales bacterium]MBL0044193.1 VOC family protein [Flavobacteriales bacterium]
MGSTVANSKLHSRLKDFVSWFEIPVYDIHRAARFYNDIYSMEMEVGYNGDFAMAYFPADKGIGGALIAGPGCTPNSTGVLIYLNAGNDLDNVLGRVELAGGRVIMSKTEISESAGSFALFIDSEGNRLALHEGPLRVSSAVKASTAKAPAPKKAAPKKKVARKAAKKR